MFYIQILEVIHINALAYRNIKPYNGCRVNVFVDFNWKIIGKYVILNRVGQLQ